VSAGQGHGCGIRSSSATGGELWCWGRNTDGELGQGDGAGGQLRSPVRVGTANDWVDVDCGQGTTCGVRADGSLWCWGDNDWGQVGTAPSGAVSSPRKADGTGYASVETDTFHTCARTLEGNLFCMGRNIEGQLGVDDTSDRSTPTLVAGASTWEQGSTGRFFTCARSTTGTIACTGANESGQLGTGDTDRRRILSMTF
jgi:alpha-tubulin suppressor-like RCC1 family protein